MKSVVDINDTFDDLFQDEPAPAPVTPVAENKPASRSGLATAIARSREVKQELEKTARQRAQEQGLKKI
jgi:hypothetical protein